jgi:putative SOS response-associated peptidase YedK
VRTIYIIQVSGPLRYKFVDGLDVPDRRLSNIQRRYNGAPSQELLVIRQNQETGERSLNLLKWGLLEARAQRHALLQRSPPRRVLDRIRRRAMRSSAR